jgi:hypothetical protein
VADTVEHAQPSAEHTEHAVEQTGRAVEPPEPTVGDTVRMPDGSVVSVNVRHQSGGLAAGVVQLARRQLDHHNLTEDYTKGCFEAYAPTPKSDDALATLRREQVVVLVADANTGRHHSAVYLLKAGGAPVLREVRREPDDRFDVDALSLGARYRVAAGPARGHQG